jgi:catechol 2,3-dioxygenase-like lactoylglutathione lyase family enzyme
MVAMLGVDDVERSLDFYSRALGFSVLERFAVGGRVVWAWVRADGIELMLTRIDPKRATGREREGRARLYLYFYPDDAVALRAALEDRGFAPRPMRVTEYGMREFELEDPDGYQLWFGEPTDAPPTARE